MAIDIFIFIFFFYGNFLKQSTIQLKQLYRNFFNLDIIVSIMRVREKLPRMTKGREFLKGIQI